MGGCECLCVPIVHDCMIHPQPGNTCRCVYLKEKGVLSLAFCQRVHAFVVSVPCYVYFHLPAYVFHCPPSHVLFGLASSTHVTVPLPSPLVKTPDWVETFG